MNRAAIEAEIRKFIEDNFVLSAGPTELSDTASLLEAGFIDSTGVLELIAFLETNFSIEIADRDAVPENLDSIRAIAQFVERKTADVSAGATGH
jgi:acyl carrier protein